MKLERLPGRWQRYARTLLILAAEVLTVVTQYYRAGERAATVDNIKASNDFVANAEALYNGFTSPDAAKKARKDKAVSDWEAAFGDLHSPEMQEKLAAFELETKRKAAQQAAPKVVRKGKRKKRG